MTHHLRRGSAVLTAMVLTLAGVLSGAPATAAPAAVLVPAAAPAVHTLAVSGTGVGSYPEFDPSINRYAITTTDATAGTVTVTATTSDPAGRVYVDGRPLTGPSTTVTGLTEGDEVAVFIVDSDGTARHSLIYLPADFPSLSAADPAADPASLADGQVLLTLGLWVAPSPSFETAVDRAGVPVMVRTTNERSMDLKPIAGGHWSVARTTAEPGRTGADIVELDAKFQEVGRHRTVGLVDTDGHDVLLQPDGSRYLLAYETDPDTLLVDAVVQQVSAAGAVLFEWNSHDYVDPVAESVVQGHPNESDYAHINSIDVMDDGDLLLSFRHLSSVFKVARTQHDGFEVGEVVWRFGGRASDFTFEDLGGGPDGGPCAQHTATQLPNGHLLMFDNGAWDLETLCIDPADPGGPLVARVPTRITEWSIDETTFDATMVWNYEVETRYAIFAGSAQRLPNGNTMIGWASSTEAMASEVGPTGNLLWDLRLDSAPLYFTYRAHQAVVPDATPPAVALGASIDGAVYRQDDVALADYSCTDRGGSSLQTCTGDVAVGARLDTRDVGSHSVRVTATDGAGNTTTRTARYTVVSGAYLPDLQARAATAGSTWHGTDKYGSTPQRLSLVLNRKPGARSAVLRVVNDGSRTDSFLLSGGGSRKGFTVTYSLAGRDVTKAVRAGTLRFASLAPGASAVLKVRIERSAAVRNGSERLVTVTVRSVARPAIRDTVVVRAVARR